ncbi:MAG: replicative DNA helicase [Bacilli bacterium]
MMTPQMPSSREAETYLVACLLIYPEETSDEILSQVSSKDFYFKDNRVIIEAVEHLYRNKKMIDVTIVTDELIRRKKLQEAGGTDNIANIMVSIPSTANVDAYITLVIEKATERQLFNEVDKIRNEILNNNLEYSVLMSMAEKNIVDVLSGRSQDDFKRVDVLTEPVINIIEENSKKDSNLVGIDTGYTELNKIINGFKSGELVILAARPGVGKSTLALNFSKNACMKDKNVAYFSLEMGHDQLIMRLFSTLTAVNLSKITSGQLSPEDMSLILNAKNTIDKWPLYIDQASTSNVRDIKAKCQNLYREGKLDMIVIDYLQLLTSADPHNTSNNRVNEVTKISRALKEMARSFGVPVIALSQLSRNIEKRQSQGVDPRPILADLRESGSIEQDADIVMFLYRDNPKKDLEGNDTTKQVRNAKTQLIIAKNRQGATGELTLVFNARNSVFNSYEK